MLFSTQIIKGGCMLFLIFISFLKISLFVIGGGLAMIPVIEDIFVKRHKLLKEQDIFDMIAVSQTIPGLIAINCAIFVGHKLAGFKGSIIAVTGVLIPSIIILSVIAAFFPLQQLDNPHLLMAFSYIRACVVGIFICMAIRLGRQVLKHFGDVLIVACLALGLICQLHILIIIGVGIIAGCGVVLWQKQINTNLKDKQGA